MKQQARNSEEGRRQVMLHIVLCARISVRACLCLCTLTDQAEEKIMGFQRSLADAESGTNTAYDNSSVLNMVKRFERRCVVWPCFPAFLLQPLEDLGVVMVLWVVLTVFSEGFITSLPFVRVSYG